MSETCSSKMKWLWLTRKRASLTLFFTVSVIAIFSLPFCCRPCTKRGELRPPWSSTFYEKELGWRDACIGGPGFVLLSVMTLLWKRHWCKKANTMHEVWNYLALIPWIMNRFSLLDGMCFCFLSWHIFVFGLYNINSCMLTWCRFGSPYLFTHYYSTLNCRFMFPA